MNARLLSIAFLACASAATARDEIADVFADPALNMKRPEDRAVAIKRIQAIEQIRLQNAQAKARAMGLPLRMEKPGGGARELVDFIDDKPLYIQTMNANAAISTAADLVRGAPYSLNGSGLTVAVWDAGGGRPTHQEFATGTRLINMNGTYTHYHSMHVAGTIAAFGVDPASRGMANAAKIHSYNWNYDLAEMTAAGATGPDQIATKVYLSNHSYGTENGWDGNYWTGSGSDQNAYDPAFGQYSSYARELDVTMYNLPYLASFWAAGNERSNNPTTGSSVNINGVFTTYNPAIHPLGDGFYRNGYETVSYRNLAKNIITIGAVNDAVTLGVRDTSKATISAFSSTGPTDDGRIKPDLVANGVNLTSTDLGSDTDYLTISGTSMATPNACGSATLLVDHYNRLKSSAMRASTLKALMIQTADDVGNPGPDYFYGWGLINVKRAADLITDFNTYPTKKRIIEDQVTTSITTRRYNFTWDGTSPIRATLAWTDPPGTATTSHDSRAATLVNNLNLKLVAPNGTEYFPFVMPFVGQWTVASMSQNATTGVNNVDNVEQVLIPNPGQTGSWQVVVSYTGMLTNSVQDFGLILSGSANEDLPLIVNSITPTTAASGSTVTMDITGERLRADTAVRLRQPGRADIIATNVQLLNATTLRCQFNLTNAASGLWSVIATNPDTKTATLSNAFTITGTVTSLWSENFDGTVTGWSSQSTNGSNSWTISTAQSHSPTKSYFAPAPSTATTTWLVSPQVAIPGSFSSLQIEFYHKYDLQGGDGGRFEISLDNGVSWFDVTDANSGASFLSNGYTTTMASSGKIGDFAGKQAWSGVSSGFVRTAIGLNNISKFAGKNMRMRWGLATNTQTSSVGWYVDSVALVSDSSTPNAAPTIATAASTSSTETQTVGPTVYQIIRGTSTGLTVTATDDAGEPDLIYTWSSSGPASVVFNTNAKNGAKNATVTFSAIGDYVLTVTATDTGGLTAASSVNVRVLATSALQVTPNPAIVQIETTEQFSAVLSDQFGAVAATQPSPIVWTVSGGGTIDNTGLFAATTVGGPYIVTASGGGHSDTADLTVTPLAKTFTGASSSSADNWNVGANWNPAGVPGGLVDLTIADGKVVTCDLATTPTYSGKLTVGAGAVLQAGMVSSSSGVFNVFGSPGTNTITMGEGSRIATRGNFTVIIPAIVMQGDVEFTMGSSSTAGTDPDFKYGITGPYVFTLNGKDGCNAKLSGPSNFGELYMTHQYGTEYTVDANVAGSLGGNVTILADSVTGGPCAIVRVNAANAMSDTATLNLSGNVGPLITFNANDTIGNLIINGVKQPAGTYTSSNSWWLGGTGTVTVLGAPAAYWNPAGGPTGTWNTSAIWNNQANLSGTNSAWVAGQLASFNASGSYGVTVSGTHDIGGLVANNGTITMSNGGLRLTGATSASVGTGASVTIGTVLSEVGEGSLHKTGGGTLTLTGNNTFSGATVIGGGTVSVASMANGGLASPLGQYPYGGAGGLVLAGGTLQYTGASTSVDRGFTFSGNSTIDVSTPGAALALGSGWTLNGTGTLTVTGGAGSTLSLGNFSVIAGMGITFNPTNIPMTVAALEGFSPYPLLSTFTLGGTSTGNVISGNVYASAYPGSAYQQGTNIVKTGTGDWTIDGIYSSTGTLTVEAGTLTLTGSNTFTGNTTLKGGKLVFDYTARNDSKMSGVLVLNGGTLEMKNGSHLDGTISTTIKAGPPSLITRNGGTSRIQLNAISREAGSSVLFAVGSVADTDDTNVNGILGGYATLGANWAINSSNGANGSITPLSTYGTWPTSVGSATTNYLLSGGSTLTGNVAANSLKIVNTANSQVLDLGANNLTITATDANSLGGILYAGGGDNQYTINGTGGIYTSATTGELILHTLTGTVTVNVPLVAAGATAGLLTKTGTGTLILNSANVYTSATRITAGKLFINGSLSDLTSGASTVTVYKGAVLGGAGTIGRTININDGGGLEFNLSTVAAGHVPLTHGNGRNLTFLGASVLTITSSGGAAPGLYTLITGSNGILGSAPSTVILPAGWTADAPVISGNKLQINITSVGTIANNAPVWTSNPMSRPGAVAGVAYSATLAGAATDADPGAFLTYGKVSGPSWLVVQTNGTLSGTPAVGDAGANTFTVSVSDGIAAPVQATLNITVSAINQPPTWDSNPISTADATEDTVYSESLAQYASDVDAGAVLSFAKVSGPSWLVVSANGDLSGTPDNTHVGANVFIVSVTDGIAAPVQTTLHIAVINTNDAPVWTSNPVSGGNALEDSNYTGSLASSVVDVDPSATLGFSKVSGPAWLSVASNGALSGIPSNNEVGGNSFTVAVSDGIAAPVNATLNITVINTNDAPEATAQSVTTVQDQAKPITLTGLDIDGNPITYAIVSSPAHGALSGTAPNVTYTPTAGYYGPDSFTFKVNDGTVDSAAATVSITVTRSNVRPQAVAQSVSTDEDTALPVTLTGTDADNDPLTYSIVSQPANGTLSGTAPNVIYTPTGHYNGADSFTFKVNDGFEDSTVATVTITVNAINDAPVFTVSPIILPGGYETIAYSGQTLAGRATDVDAGDALTYSKVSGPAWLTVATNGALSGTPPIGASGVNSFVVRVTDSASATADATLQISVSITGLTWDANGTGSGQTNGAGAWLGANLWWDSSTSSNRAWSSGSSATFGGPSTGGGAVTLASPTAVNMMVFNTFTSTYTLGTAGQALTINGGIDKTSTSAAVSIVSPVILGAAQTWTNNSTTTLTTSTGTNLLDNGGYQLTVTGSGNTTFGLINQTAVALTGSGALVKNGSGLLSIGGANTGFSGNVTVNEGVIRMTNHADGLGTGNINLNGGILELYWDLNNTRTLGAGPGEIQVTGGASGFSMNNGNRLYSVTLNNSAAYEVVWASSYFNPSILVFQSDYSQAAASTTLANKLDLNGSTRTIKVNGGTAGTARATISGQIRTSTGTAGITKTGSGILILSNASNAWNGATSIQAGLLDLSGITNANLGGGSGRNVSVSAGAGVRFNALSNTYLNRIAETSSEIAVMTGTTANDLDFSSSAGASLPNAFLGCWSSTGVKAELSGTITPASDAYRLGGIGSSGLLGIVGTNKLTGARGLIVGQTGSTGIRVELAGANDFTGNTVVRDGSRLFLGNNLALQNSILDIGSSSHTGTFGLSDGTNTGRITGDVASPSPTFGGLAGSRNLLSAYDGTSPGTGATLLASTAVTGFTLNPGAGVSCTYSGAIADFAVGTTLTKTGPGTQILAGGNSYTGATSVNGGRLFINGNQTNATGNVTVAANATLGGTGIIGGNTTVADSGQLEFNLSTSAASHDGLELASSRTLTFSGTSVLTITSSGGAGVGTYTLLTAPGGISGNAPATLNLPSGWAATVSVSGNNLLLNVTSTGSALHHFAISSITSTQTIGTPITGITVTAQDASNNTVTSFTGTVSFGGTGGFSGTSANFVAGVLTNVSVTPTVAGSNLTLTVGNGAGITGSTTIATIQTRFTSWAGGATFYGDGNGDGVANGLAWVLGATGPNASVTAQLPTLTTGGGNMIFTFKRRQESIDPNTAVTIEVGTTLTSWQTSYVVGADTANSSAGVTVTKDSPSVGTDTVTLSVPQSTDTRKFARLKVVQTP